MLRGVGLTLDHIDLIDRIAFNEIHCVDLGYGTLNIMPSCALAYILSFVIRITSRICFLNAFLVLLLTALNSA